MSDDEKSWEKPLYPEEIAENASNWSFAADLSLLKYLEVFSEDLLNKATAVDNNVNALLDNLSKASLSLEIAKNEFLSLSNTQFIESRVYEDDETLQSNEEKVETEEPDEKDEEEYNETELRLAAERGVEIIEKYFDKVEITDSDSEGDNLTSFMLRPKNPYAKRPLPYIIGSKLWHKKWHVGLAESSSESEDEKLSEKSSETDSESDLPNTNVSQMKSVSGSGSSEIDLSNKLDLPVANSTFNDTNKQDDYLGSSAEDSSISAQARISQNLFAEELAAKLDDVVKNENQEAPINKKPIRKGNNYEKYGNIFLDEPPPLDDMDDVLSSKSKDQGIFSGGDGLFDDMDDDQLFWGTGVVERQSEVPNAAKASSNLFDEDEDLFVDIVKGETKSTSDNKFKNDLNNKLNKPKVPSIFDDDNESDEDYLFGKPSIKPNLINKSTKDSLFDEDDIEAPPTSEAKKKSSNLFDEEQAFESKKQISLFDDEDPINIGSPKRKAPVGGIQVINNPNLFSDRNVKNLLKNKPRSSLGSSEKEPDESDTKKVPTKMPENEDVKHAKEETKPFEKEKKSYNLFDDDDDLFKDDLFSNTSSKKTNIFAKKGGLFDDTDKESDEEDRLGSFDSKQKRNERDSVKHEEKKEKADMFSNEIEESSSKIEDQVKKPKQSAFKDPLNEDVGEEKSRNIIFDEESDSDDLFSSKQSKVISKNKIAEDVSIIKAEPEKILPKEKRRKLPSLFDDDDDYEDLFSSNFLQRKEPSSPVVNTEKGLRMTNDLFDDEEDLFSVIKAVRREEESKETEDNIFRSDKKGPSEDEGDVFGSNYEDEFFKPTKTKKLSFKHKLFEDDEEFGDDIFGYKSHRNKKDERNDKSEGIMNEGGRQNKNEDLGDDLFRIKSGEKKDEKIEESEAIMKNDVGQNEDDIFGTKKKKGVDRKEDRDGLDDDAFEIENNQKKNEEISEESKGVTKKGVGQNQDGDVLDDGASGIKNHQKKNEEICQNEGSYGLGDFEIETHQKKNEEIDVKSRKLTTKGHNEGSDGLGDETSRIESDRKKSDEIDHESEKVAKYGRNIEGRDLQDTKEEDVSGDEERRNEDDVDRLKKDVSAINAIKIEGAQREASIKRDISTNSKSAVEETDQTGDSSIRNKFSSTAARIPSVSIFDPNPPPDLEDWDARSEPNAFEDEIFPFDSTDNFGENPSSIFDREPPSVFNESSGIVKDQSVRAETDISSFYPYASSSRRFSTDFFNEESTDSLLTTKPRHSFEPNIPPSITEKSEDTFSNLEITPSGRVDELYSEISEPTRSRKSVTFEDHVGGKRGTRAGEGEASEESVEDARVDRAKPVVSKKPDLKKKVGEKSVNEDVRKEENIGKATPDVSEEKTEKNQTGNEGSPGKVKHNLNINVFALLPGAGKPPKKDAPHPPEHIQRSDSLNTADTTVDSSVEKTPKREVKSEDVQSTIENVEVLGSITKGRARGPVRRKPSTKRGREAIRNSCVDLTFVSSPTTEDENETKEEVVSTEKRSFKDELQAKLLQSPKSKQATAAGVTNEKIEEIHVVNKSISTSNSKLIKKDSNNTEDVPKITVETFDHQQTSIIKESNHRKQINVNDSVTDIADLTKAEMETENVIEFSETSSGRVRRIDRLGERTRLQDIFGEKTEDLPKIDAETSSRSKKDSTDRSVEARIGRGERARSQGIFGEKTENVPKIDAETSSRSRKDLIDRSVESRIGRGERARLQGIFGEKTEDAPKIDAETSSRSRKDLTDRSVESRIGRGERARSQGIFGEKTEDVPKIDAETSTRSKKDLTDRLIEPRIGRGEKARSQGIFSEKTEDLPKIDGETSSRSKKNLIANFLNDLITKEAESDKDARAKPEDVSGISETLDRSKRFGKTEDVKIAENKPKRTTIGDLIGGERGDDGKSKTTKVKSNAETKESRETDIFKTCSEKSTRKKNIFGDDDDDLDLFSSHKTKTKKENASNFLAVGGENPGFFDFTRRSSFVKTDNFASPEFIKENLSEDEENDDVFSEKKLPPKSDILKRSPFDDDDDEDDDLLGSRPKDTKQASATTSTTTRRLKISTLKKLENTIVTGDDPLSALDK